jgi:hypothetical protein
MLWFNGKKNSGGGVPAKAGRGVRRHVRREYLRGSEYQSFVAGSKSLDLGQVVGDESRYYGTFYRACARYIPIVSDAVWVWTNLCATGQVARYIGGSEASRAKSKERVVALDARLSPYKTARSGSIDWLVREFFGRLSTYGRVCALMEIDAGLRGVASVRMVDPFAVKFDREGRVWIRDRHGVYGETNPALVYYYGLGGDSENPYGVAMLDAAYSLIEIADGMLQDMKNASSNAGVPRLHIKIKQPSQAEHESDDDYRDRASDYFDGTVGNFQEIGSDDNIYTWDDVTIGIVGGEQQTGGYVWRTNRGAVQEEVISAFHLYPWVMGFSASTTKNWVGSQYDLLMAQVEALQLEGGHFAEWIVNTDLRLGGVADTRVEREFRLVRDPSAKDYAYAEKAHIENVTAKVLAGMISSDDGARELGYDKAYDPDMIYKRQKSGAEEKGRDGEEHAEERHAEILERIEALAEAVKGGGK